MEIKVSLQKLAMMAEIVQVFFYQKSRIGASIESCLKSSDFENSRFLANFLRASQRSSCLLPVSSCIFQNVPDNVSLPREGGSAHKVAH